MLSARSAAWMTAAIGVLLVCAVPVAAQRRVIRPDGAPTDRPYSPGVLVGQTLYISGNSACPGPAPRRRTMDAQARQAMDGVGAVLEGRRPRLPAPREVPRLPREHGRLRGHERGLRLVLHRPRPGPDDGAGRGACRRVRAIEIACIGYADLAAHLGGAAAGGSLPAPLGPYSPAVWAGDTLYVSGMGGQDPATKAVGESVEAQVTQTVANITTTLKAAGLASRTSSGRRAMPRASQRRPRSTDDAGRARSTSPRGAGGGPAAARSDPGRADVHRDQAAVARARIGARILRPGDAGRRSTVDAGAATGR